MEKDHDVAVAAPEEEVELDPLVYGIKFKHEGRVERGKHEEALDHAHLSKSDYFLQEITDVEGGSVVKLSAWSRGAAW